MKKQQPTHLPVEKAFDEYVQAFGGKLVRNVIPAKVRNTKGFLNADYLFPDEQEPIIAELKCLEHNLFATKEFNANLLKLHREWVRKGLIPPQLSSKFRIDTSQLPGQCSREVFQLVKNPIERVIGKASDQIKKSRDYLNLPQAKGLLLLVNDGHQGLHPQQLLETVGWILTNQEKAGINSTVILTTNLRAAMPGINRDILVWGDAPRPGMEPVSRVFLDRFREGWMRFFETKQGETVPVIHLSDHAALSLIKNIKL